jgi:hypothetical protein
MVLIVSEIDGQQKLIDDDDDNDNGSKDGKPWRL